MTDYSRDAIIDKLDDILGSEQKDENKRANLVKKTLLLVILFAFVCVSAFGIGMFKGIIDNAPDVDTLQFGPTGFASKAYDIEGNLIATLVQEGSNREEATFEELPDDLILHCLCKCHVFQSPWISSCGLQRVSVISANAGN